MAQTFNAHWWNGRGYLMDFRTSPPTITCSLPSDGAFEATSSWSDPVSGDLIFYVDNGTVRDNTGTLYSNGTGLNTNATRTQMAVVMPVPGANFEQVYVLHGNGRDEDRDGTVYYSIVDIPTQTVTSKNNLLHSNTTEALYGTNTGTLCGAWIASIANDNGSCTTNCAASIELWQIDESNLLNTARANSPDLSFSLPINLPRRGERATIRFSERNDMIAIAIEGGGSTANGGIFYASFDAPTGTIGSWTQVPLSTTANTITGYSVEFSPDSSRLFFAHQNGTGSRYDGQGIGWSDPLWVHVIGNTSSSQIDATSAYSGVQLGPDGNLYYSRSGSTTIRRVTNPNTVTGSGNAVFDNLSLSCGSTQGFNFTQQVLFLETCMVDTDEDGQNDNIDIDDDNDGIKDTDEGTTDTDGDGLIDSVDLDSDGDGIPDNVEAQASGSYLPPSNTDSDGNGLDDAYETTPGSGEGLTPVNTDGIDNPDYKDTDSDNADSSDTVEAGLTLSGSDSDGDGLDNTIDTTTGYDDPGGSIDDPTTGAVTLPDTDGDLGSGGDLDFRDVLVVNDSDGDGLNNDVDYDDDNDGITDAQELCGTDPVIGSSSATITITIDLDRWEGETTWTLVDPSSTTIGSGGPYNNGDEIITQNFNVSDSGTYTFTIFDSFGDGLNSSGASDSNGSAGYSIDLDASNVFTSANYPNFGSSSAHAIVVSIAGSNPFTCLTSDPNADDDSDGILNYLEADYAAANGSTLNANGVIAILDTDGDGIIDSSDLDSDNDGIYDIVESGALTVGGVDDTDLDGRIDTADVPANVGANGVFDTLETSAESGVLNYTITDTDALNERDFQSADADGDGCSDVVEAGFTDDNSDDYLGPASVIVNSNGVVTSGSDGYTSPADENTNSTFDFQEAGSAPSITTQPTDTTVCPGCSANFTVAAAGNRFQWQLFDGSSWNDLSDSGVYSGTTTTTLAISNVDTSDNGNQYRVLVWHASFICGQTVSNTATLSTQVPTVITNRRITYRVNKN
ncbi:hypothetical protein ABV409_16610 [Flagellimonas sp. DF-77]|uniref:beta strand repeat-containing protein n=1 Tax=Flagellimonas algarum TaxID=3230298 RepID=UPI00339B27BB